MSTIAAINKVSAEDPLQTAWLASYLANDKINARSDTWKRMAEFLNKITRRCLQDSYKGREKVVLIKFCEDYSGLWSGVIAEDPRCDFRS